MDEKMQTELEAAAATNEDRQGYGDLQKCALSSGVRSARSRERARGCRGVAPTATAFPLAWAHKMSEIHSGSARCHMTGGG